MAVADVAMTIFQVVLRPLSLPLELEPDEPLSKFVIRYILNITLYKIWLKKYVIIDFGMNWSLDLKKTIFFIYHDMRLYNFEYIKYTDVTVVVTAAELGFTLLPLWEAAALDPVCVTDNVDVTLPPPVCPLVDPTLVVAVFDVEESVVTELVVEESVVGGGVVVHGPGVHDGFTGTVHVLVDVQSAKAMSSEARQQSALDKFKSNFKTA